MSKQGTAQDGHFTKGSKLDKIMNTLAQYPGVWFSSATVSETTGINYNTTRGILILLKKFDCIISKSVGSGKAEKEFHTIFTIDSDSLSRYYARLRD